MSRTKQCEEIGIHGRCQAYLGHPGSHGASTPPKDLRVVPVTEAMALEIAYLRYENVALQERVLGSTSVSPDTGPGMYECPHCDGTGGIHYDSRAAWLADGKVKL